MRSSDNVTVAVRVMMPGLLVARMLILRNRLRSGS